MTKHIAFTLSIIIITLFYLSYISAFGNLGALIQLPLLIAVIITTFVSYQRGYLFALGAGIMLDIYSTHVFGTYTIAMIVPVMVMYAAFRKLFARKSLYAMVALMITSTVAYHVVVWLMTELYYVLGWRHYAAQDIVTYIPRVGLQIILHSILISLFVVLTQTLGKRLRSVFRINERV